MVVNDTLLVPVSLLDGRVGEMLNCLGTELIHNVHVWEVCDKYTNSIRASLAAVTTVFMGTTLERVLDADSDFRFVFAIYTKTKG